MSQTIISLNSTDERRVSPTSTKDEPVGEDTVILVYLSEIIVLSTTVGEWRRVVSEVDAEIEGIPAKRAQYREVQERWEQRRRDEEAEQNVQAPA